MARPLTILFLGPAVSPHVTRWVEFLRGRGHRVVLATLHAVEIDEDTVLLTGRPRQGPLSLRAVPGAVRRLRALRRELDPDVTVAYYLTSYGLLARLAGVRPTVGAAAGGDVLADEFDSGLQRLRNRLVLGYVLGGVDAMLAWAPHVGSRLEELGVPADHILVQPRGVDTGLFPFREPRRRGPGEPLRLLSLRWLKPLYRVDTLVEALVTLRREGVRFEARIVGDGPERERLERMARDGGLGADLAFLGAVPGETVPDHLAWADVYVSTSCTDGASSSLFEAMAVGAYPLVSDIPANRSTLDPGRTGGLFPVGDAAALAGACARLAADDAERRRGIAAARAVVRDRLDFRRNMERIEQFVVARARRARGGGASGT